MKKQYNKDKSVDYIFTVKEFSDYMVGCVVKMTDKKVIVRVYGPAKDLSQVVIKKKK